MDDLADAYQHLAKEKRLILVWACAPVLEVFSDPDLVRQILHNLLGNALRYAHSEVEVNVSRDDSVLTVRISNDCHVKTMATSGLGLGLRLARGICEATRIQLEIHPTIHHFSTTLRIPNFPNS